jgi:hypothetical protein
VWVGNLAVPFKLFTQPTSNGREPEKLSEPVGDESEGVFFPGEVLAVPRYEPEAMINGQGGLKSVRKLLR